MTLISILSLSVAMLIFTASPGPGVFATVARSLASGFGPALALIIGVVVGDIIYLMFAVFGLSVVAQALGNLFILVKICGGTYVFWLGLRIWISKPREAGSKQSYEKQSRLGNTISGLLITLSNPKVILFYCGLLPAFIDLSVLKVFDMALLVGVVTFVLSSVLITYAYLASHARQLFFSQIAMKRINRSAGGVMMTTGVAIATHS